MTRESALLAASRPCDAPPPLRLKVKVEAIYKDDKEVTASQSGENLRLRITGAEDTDISSGFVLSRCGDWRGGSQVSAVNSECRSLLASSGGFRQQISPPLSPLRNCSIKNPVPCVTVFEAQLMIVELLEHNPVFTVGYKSVLHIHTACEECEVTKLISEVDPKTKEQKKARSVVDLGSQPHVKVESCSFCL